MLAKPRRRQPLVRAMCHFPAGHVARLLVADLSPTGAFICSVRPPQVGVELSVTLEAEAEPPVHALKCRVISTRIDPSSAERTGFEIRFVDLPFRQQERLLDLIGFLGDQPLPARITAGASRSERRAQPRVDVDFYADLTLRRGVETFRMKNLSMSGALLMGPELPVGLTQGVEIEMLLYASDIPEALTLQCEVVRLITDDEPPRLAVRFRDMNETDEAVLESLMLYALIQHGFPTYPYVGS